MPLDPKKITAIREQRKLSQVEAARRAGMRPPHWSRIESGNRTDQNLSTAQRVADALECELEEIVSPAK